MLLFNFLPYESPLQVPINASYAEVALWTVASSDYHGMQCYCSLDGWKYKENIIHMENIIWEIIYYRNFMRGWGLLELYSKFLKGS